MEQEGILGFFFGDLGVTSPSGVGEHVGPHSDVRVSALDHSGGGPTQGRLNGGHISLIDPNGCITLLTVLNKLLRTISAVSS